MIQAQKKILLATVKQRFFARIIDLLLCSMVILLLALLTTLTLKTTIHTSIIIMIGSNFIVLLSYFILVPLFNHNATFGKTICKITLHSKTKITWWKYFIRESFYIFIPTICFFILYGILMIFKINFNIITTINHENAFLRVLSRVFLSAIFIWFCGILLVLKIDPQKQMFFDVKMQIYVVKIKNEKKMKIHSPNQPPAKTSKTKNLFNLRPGMIDTEILKNINDQQKEKNQHKGEKRND